ncbi:MAG: Brp/Blh family beta-carotene 15,15'-dioxygenase [Bacteroidota bacterium]
MLRWKILLLVSVWLVPNEWLLSTPALVMATILVLALGIPHGATDHVVFNVLRQKEVRTRVPGVFLLGYLGVMLLYFLLWWWQPAGSLLVFLVISAYHFGETQLIRTPQVGVAMHGLYLSWGGLMLAVLLLLHLEEVTQLLLPLVGHPAVFVWLGQHTVTLLALAAGQILLLWAWQAFRTGRVKYLTAQVAELCVLLLLLWRTPVLIGFAIFFAFWHSRDAITEQLDRFRVLRPQIRWWEWVRMALPYTMMSVVGIVGLVAVWWVYRVSISPVTVFFVGVSLLTMPHMILIYRFYQLPTSQFEGEALVSPR